MSGSMAGAHVLAGAGFWQNWRGGVSVCAHASGGSGALVGGRMGAGALAAMGLLVLCLHLYWRWWQLGWGAGGGEVASIHEHVTKFLNFCLIFFLSHRHFYWKATSCSKVTLTACNQMGEVGYRWAPRAGPRLELMTSGASGRKPFGLECAGPAEIQK